MVRQHFQDASKRPPLSHFETGFHGAPVDVTLAVDAIDDPQQAPLYLMEIAMGATEALSQGRPENIQAFFSHDSDASRYDGYILSQIVTGITFCQLRLALKDMPRDRKRQALTESKSLLSNDTHANHDAALRILEIAGSPRENASAPPCESTTGNLRGHDVLQLKNG